MLNCVEKRAIVSCKKLLCNPFNVSCKLFSVQAKHEAYHVNRSVFCVYRLSSILCIVVCFRVCSDLFMKLLFNQTSQKFLTECHTVKKFCEILFTIFYSMYFKILSSFELASVPACMCYDTIIYGTY